MSMRDYGVQDYGLVLDKNTLKLIAEKLYADEYKDYDNPKAAFEADFAEDPYDFICGMEDKLGFCSYGEFTGEACRLSEKGEATWIDDVSYSCSNIYYVPLSKNPTLFSAAYTSFQEIINEVKEKFGM